MEDDLSPNNLTNDTSDNSSIIDKKYNPVISDLETDLDVSIIKSITNLLLYRETFPIPSLLYEKNNNKYIRDTIPDSEKRKKFNVEIILEQINNKKDELNKNLKNKKEIKKEKTDIASTLILEANIEKLKTKESRHILRTQRNWELFNKISSSVYDFIINNFPTFLKYIIDYIGGFIHTLFVTFNSKWTNVFAGFVIVGAFIMLVNYLTSKNKSDNNKSSRRNSSTTENMFALPDFQLKIDNMLAEFNSVSKRINDNVTLVNETISSVTTADLDDINRSKLPTGRGADNLYHFNGKDLNKMNLKNGIYDENSVYSIYKPIDIKNKEFNIKWKSEKEEENSKYVFDCSDESMKDHFNGDCTVKTYDVIVSDKDNICTEPI